MMRVAELISLLQREEDQTKLVTLVPPNSTERYRVSGVSFHDTVKIEGTRIEVSDAVLATAQARQVCMRSDCGKPRAGSQFCATHECKYPGCNNGPQKHRDYCGPHETKAYKEAFGG